MNAPVPDSLLERSAPLEVLSEVWHDLARGRHAVVIVEGAAGMGKTSVLRRAVRSARRAGLTVGEVTGLEVEAEIPFALAARLLRPLVRRAPSRRELFDAATEPAAILLDDGSGHVPVPTATVALTHLTERLGASRPLALVVDDVHWSDGPSASWLRYLAARESDSPIALVLSTRPRPEAGSAIHDEVAALRRMEGTTFLRLEPLSVDAVERILRERIGTLTPASARTCHDITGGNPFFVLEVASELAVVSRCSERPLPVLSAALPTVQRRVSALAEPSRRLARAAAILGGEFSLETAAAVAELDWTAVAEAVADLERSAIFEPGRDRFVHALVARTVAISMSRDERDALHRSAARVLRAADAHPLIVGKHLLETPHRGEPETVAALLAATKLARRARQPGLALAFAERASAEPPAPHQERSVGQELARAAASAGDARWETFVGALVEPTEDGAELLRIVGRELYAASRLEDAARAFEWGLSLSAGSPDLRLLLLARFVQATRAQVARPNDRLDLLDALADALEHHPNQGGVAWREAAGCLAYQQAISGAAASVVSTTARAALDPVRVTDREVLDVLTYFTAVQAASMVGADVEPAAIERAIEVAERLSLPGITQTALSYRGARRYREGRIDDAVADFDAALELGELTVLLVPKIAADRALALYERGAVLQAAGSLELPSVSHYEATGYYNGYLRARGVLSAERGDLVGALEDFRRCGERERQVLAEGAIAIPWIFDAALCLARLGRYAEAQTAASDGLVAARHQGVPFRIAHGLRALAASRPERDPEPLLREALDRLDDSPWGLERAEVRLALGRHLLAVGCREEGAGLVRLAADSAHRSGAVRLGGLALAALRATGARPRRMAVTGEEALTPTEREVVRLAAEGQTNTSIAAQRGVSAKAIEYHLTHAFRKLGVRSRMELIARREQLLGGDPPGGR